jgi:CRP-like cAMP-binding protein
MEHEFAKYLSKHTSLTNEQIDLIVENTVVKNFKKGTVLLREGDRANECYLILKGCIRSYVIKDCEEKTIEFYTEEEPVSSPSFDTPTPSELYLECVEDTVACISTPELEAEMHRKCPELESAHRIVAEKLIANYHASFADYKTASIEERYLHLLKERPHKTSRVI